MDKPIRVMIVDDHLIVRDGLQEVLERAGGFEVTGLAGDGQEAVQVASDTRPDVVIMDVLMPVMDGIEACREIKDALPETQILVLTASTDGDAVLDAVAAGANGYLQKFLGKEKLLTTIREVAQGEYRIPPEAMRRIIAGYRPAQQQPESSDLNVLTQREREILTMFVQGLTYTEIAAARGNSPLTIRNAVYAAQRKVGARDKRELVIWAMRNGLMDSNVS